MNEPPLRIEVTPVGFYIDRIVEPVRRHDADVVYLVLGSSRKSDGSATFLKEVIRQLRNWKPRLTIHEVRADRWNLETALETFSQIVQKEVAAGNSVWVNVSTGSKLEAIAGALATMAHGGVAYYVRMRSYDERRSPKPLAEGVVGIDVIPTYGLPSPSPAALEVLRLLEGYPDGQPKQWLVAELEQSRVIPSVRAGGSSVSIQSKYGRLQSILDELTRDPTLVRITGQRRSTRILIEPRGRIALRIFGSGKSRKGP
ncbi:MAG TPA: DUF6293 family protein [Thermoplasmata archaeon]|nr:DUF6293 family protein [Thermoplasmata archaeon]